MPPPLCPKTLQAPSTASSGRKLIVVSCGGSYVLLLSVRFESRSIQPPVAPLSKLVSTGRREMRPLAISHPNIRPIERHSKGSVSGGPELENADDGSGARLELRYCTGGLICNPNVRAVECDSGGVYAGPSDRVGPQNRTGAR